MALGLAEAFEGLERDVAQHADGLRLDLRVGLVTRDGGERGRVHQLRDRRSPHARIGVLAGDLGEQIALLERDLLHEREADGGVGMLVTRLGAKPIENCHTRSSLTARVSL